MNHRPRPDGCRASGGRAQRSILWIALSLFVAGGLGAQEEKDEQGRTVVRQGGYVEHVDPNADYSGRMKRISPREPAESLAGFHIIAGFRSELVASEPLIRDAVDIAFDEDSRLFVVEMSTYPEAGDTRAGRVSRLIDDDGDGRYDRSTVYADGMMWPTGIVCWGGGIFVASAPDVLYFKDTDGDGRADLREVVLTGFETTNPNAFPNSLRWGLDGWIHGMSSTAGGLLRAVKWERGGEGRETRPVQCRGRDFRFDPRTGALELESGGSQFGMAYDEWGRKFESSNSAPIEMVMYEDRYIARNPHLVAPASRVMIRQGPNRVFRTSEVEPWRVIRTEMRIAKSFSGPVEGGGKPAGYFTAACGVTVYTGDAWPEEYRGSALVCEGAGNLVHRMRLEPSGVGLTAHRTEAGREFLTSDEVWFRPIQLVNAPDGALHIADMYREIFEHPDAVPPSIKKFLDLNAGNDRGRVWRIVPDGFRQRPPARLARASTAALVETLAHPNGWHRWTAARLLCERRDSLAVRPLLTLARESESPLARIHALWALGAQGALSADVIAHALTDAHPRVREHAVRLAEDLLASSPSLREALYPLATDDDARVRYQLAFTLGEIPSARATAALAAIVRRDGGDRWARLAVLSSVSGRAGDLLARLSGDREWRSTAAGRAILGPLSELVGLGSRADQVAVVLATVRSLGDDKSALAEVVVEGLGRGLEKSASPLRSQLAGGAAAGILARIVADARAVAVDASAPAEKRVEAIRSLALAPYDEIGEVLAGLLGGREPRAVQIAAVQTLGRFDSRGVAGAILDAWAGFSPQVRGEASEVLFARPERVVAFLDAITAEDVAPSEIDPVRVQLLERHPDAAIAARARELFAGVRAGGRADVVEAYTGVLERKGDVERGREAFRKNCSTCHRLEGFGTELGLPLTSVKARGEETILISVLDPNREVNPQYLNYLVVTESGQTLTGLITAETATSVTLGRAEGATDTVLRVDIADLSNTGISIMPEALEEELGEQGVADVIAYLMAVE